MSDPIQKAASHFGGAVKVAGNRVTVVDAAKLRTEAMDTLAWDAVFGDEATREAARWLLWELGQAMGCRPASIQDLYAARGRGECGGFTVPAM
ncbi:MAG TPA: aldolase, partial [Gemmatimonadales bacterium]|nr:aldolase [Gemmatimonadales bacterium]